MARAKKPDSPAPAGHNSNGKLTEEEAAALTTHFALKVIEDERVVAQKKADLDAARSKVNGHFKLIANDLGITRKDFEANVLAVMGMSEAEYACAEAKRSRLHRLAGVKPGEQLDLVEAIADTVDEALNAERDGYRAGRRADDPTPPTTLSTIFVQDWMRGYHAGQEFNALQLSKAAEILARPRPGEMAPADDEGDEEQVDDTDPETIRKKANALKDSGWTEPTGDETDFEQQAA